MPGHVDLPSSCRLHSCPGSTIVSSPQEEGRKLGCSVWPFCTTKMQPAGLDSKDQVERVKDNGRCPLVVIFGAFPVGIKKSR